MLSLTAKEETEITSEQLEFDPFAEFETLRSWNIETNVPREFVPSFCESLEGIVSESGGGFYYFPRSEPNMTRCRYDWFLRLKGEFYGLRITLVFDVGDSDVQKLSAYLSLGPKYYGENQLVNTKVEKRVIDEVLRVIDKVNEIADGSILADFCPLYYLALPKFTFLGTDVSTDKAIIYASARDKKTTDHIAGVSIRVSAFSAKASGQKAINQLDRLVVLLSVLANLSFQIARPEFPKGRANKSKRIRDSFPPMSQVYPGKRYVVPSEYPSINSELKDLCETALAVLHSNGIEQDELLWRAMCAYVSGQEIHERHPTLASVAYVAALSVFSQPTTCSGSVSCTICGERPPHHLQGDAEAITQHVTSSLGLDSGDEQTARRVIREVYSKQRSSYVHDAILRHSELKDLDVSIGRPGRNSHISEELKFKEELMSIKGLTRRMLLKHLCDHCNEVLPLLEEASNREIHTTIPMAGNITVAKAGRPVGFRIRSSKWDEASNEFDPNRQN